MQFYEIFTRADLHRLRNSTDCQELITSDQVKARLKQAGISFHYYLLLLFANSIIAYDYVVYGEETHNQGSSTTDIFTINESEEDKRFNRTHYTNVTEAVEALKWSEIMESTKVTFVLNVLKDNWPSRNVIIFSSWYFYLFFLCSFLIFHKIRTAHFLISHSFHQGIKLENHPQLLTAGKTFCELEQ